MNWIEYNDNLPDITTLKIWKKQWIDERKSGSVVKGFNIFSILDIETNEFKTIVEVNGRDDYDGRYFIYEYFDKSNIKIYEVFRN